MITINIAADAKYPFDRTALRNHLEKILEAHQLKDGIEVEVEVVGKRKMSQIHQTYMQVAGPTDVLSFPLNDPADDRPFLMPPDGILRMGDIVICYPEAVTEALEKQIKVDIQIQFLAEHGLMHLLGFHHE
ncbi:TPA: rRNA maturation RNase YbeY [Candidatus Collierbacteria bacterium]|uniref:rRNA maturation RNase YbeY n=2 Tax=Candidatus Collieribacteriota TaxID=1752725 RepID=A0A1F5FX65_9BACT|nr:MAG: putative rRNA maturation factor [Microgenomates group bacterium GW2011_GWF1_46_12]KKU27576.1 MAG: putative rRNA maturation factor [Microgenomates group bacterium GW2011_GWF2_46_18]KKU43616.1 MAG: putative rRNA maturation factor [Microgenomates group bacterium GW2011_GWA1_46_7]KKU44686.1 MAG: putative rRNA maturation factor [Microgenomates group bacterium GW2011_GWB1_46_7]KKU60266.1 MAG: putative rRNA maturation factor [Microgenomates group bacterium GW2011_GWE1_47_12]KKU62416.1 MAG: pu